MKKSILSAAVCGVLVLSGAEGTPRGYQMRQRALVENAMAFFLKGAAMQYDSAPLTVAGMQKNGVGLRQQYFEAPEGATKDRTRYLVCTTYALEIYYQTFGWKLGGGVPGCFTANMEKNLPAELIVFRQDNLACPDGKTAAAAQARALLETGDLLVDFVPEHWSHAMFYAGDTDGDGRDEVLHSSGRKYDTVSGLDAVEIGGSIYKDDAESLFFTPGNGSLHDLTRVNRYFIVRPLRLSAKDWPLTPSSETRLRYPRLRIDRTVSGGVYGSVPTGGALVYTIEISNHSTDRYKDIPVTECVPAGTELVAGSVTCGGAAAKGQIVWRVDVPAGGAKKLSYAVKVTAVRGATIVSGGGSVGKIPSNTLKTSVGGEEIDCFNLRTDGWHDAVAKSGATGTAFAEAAYMEALGVALKLPRVREFFDGLFAPETLKDKQGRETTVYRMRKTGAPKAAALLVPGWFGGRHIVTDAGENRVLECRAADLKRGDIVVYGNLPLDEEHVKAFVYTGCEELTLADGKIVSVLDRGVTALLSYDVFAALRPTLAADPGPDGSL